MVTQSLTLSGWACSGAFSIALLRSDMLQHKLQPRWHLTYGTTASGRCMLQLHDEDLLSVFSFICELLFFGLCFCCLFDLNYPKKGDVVWRLRRIYEWTGVAATGCACKVKNNCACVTKYFSHCNTYIYMYVCRCVRWYYIFGRYEMMSSCECWLTAAVLMFVFNLGATIFFFLVFLFFNSNCMVLLWKCWAKEIHISIMFK